MLMQRVLVLVVTVSAVTFLSSLGWQDVAQAAQAEKAHEGGDSESITLKLAGDKGTPFSGTCSVGGEEHDISGQVPRSFGFDPGSQKLECEIGKQGDESGELKVVLSSAEARSVQRVEGRDVTLRLTYAKGSLSSSTTSSSSRASSSSSFSQTVISGSNNSSASGANGDARGGDDAASLAERTIKRVFKEVGLKN